MVMMDEQSGRRNVHHSPSSCVTKTLQTSKYYLRSTSTVDSVSAGRE